MALILEKPITGGTLHALFLIDHGLSIFFQIDRPHGADGVTVSTPNTFFLVNFHKNVAPQKAGIHLGDSPFCRRYF
jgi:hypothetical protein